MTPSALAANTPSAAEARVFTLLGRTTVREDNEASCFHSLNISHHDYKIVGELDFVVLSRRGVLVLEVKGGGVDCHDGIWTFTDRFGVEHRRSESPFQQARSGMFSLKQRLERHFGVETIRRLPWGYGVVFPDTDFDVRSVEWEDAMVLDADVLRGRHDLTEPVEALLIYWQSKRSRDDLLPPARIREIGSLLRPSFERIPSLRHRADQLDVAMEHLTEDQYQQLDIIDGNPRILCAGGAGTGKTFLGIELARRAAAAGERCLFVTSTPVLGAFTRSRLGASTVGVATPRELPSGPFDVLVVDEGQDILNLDDLAELDRVLVGGLEGGRWRFFYDINRQSGLVGRFDEEALDLLRSYGGVSARLTKNCRNTHEIVLQTKLLTAADLGTASAGHGPPVEYEFYGSREEQVALIDAHLRALQDDDIPPGEVTILSPRPFEESAASASRPARRGRLTPLDQATAAQWPVNTTTFAEVADFKGLENRFVLLVDIDHIDDVSSDVNTVYVAMSRARTGLWVAMNEELEARAAAISMANLPDVIGEAQLEAD
jgi:hypothetical protein